MKRLIASLLFVAASGCLTSVEDRWCGPMLPCSAGFVCTPDFHCHK